MRFGAKVGTTSFGAKVGPKIGSGNKGLIYVLEGLSHKYKNYVIKKFKYVNPNGPEIKVLPKYMHAKFSYKRQLESFMNEVHVQQLASVLGIAPKVLTFTEDYMVMERIRGTTLHNYLKHHRWDTIRSKVSRAIKKMHDAKIQHNDLTDHNIMIGHDNKVYIIDFGSAVFDPDFTDEDFEYDTVLFA
jgi:Kae1-associated kinase Bud32